MTGAWSTPIPFGCGPSKVGPCLPDVHWRSLWRANGLCLRCGPQGAHGEWPEVIPRGRWGAPRHNRVASGRAHRHAGIRGDCRPRLQALGRYGDAMDGDRPKPVLRLSLDRAGSHLPLAGGWDFLYFGGVLRIARRVYPVWPLVSCRDVLAANVLSITIGYGLAMIAVFSFAALVRSVLMRRERRS